MGRRSTYDKNFPTFVTFPTPPQQDDDEEQQRQQRRQQQEQQRQEKQQQRQQQKSEATQKDHQEEQLQQDDEKVEKSKPAEEHQQQGEEEQQLQQSGYIYDWTQINQQKRRQSEKLQKQKDLIERLDQQRRDSLEQQRRDSIEQQRVQQLIEHWDRSHTQFDYDEDDDVENKQKPPPPPEEKTHQEQENAKQKQQQQKERAKQKQQQLELRAKHKQQQLKEEEMQRQQQLKEKEKQRQEKQKQKEQQQKEKQKQKEQQQKQKQKQKEEQQREKQKQKEQQQKAEEKRLLQQQKEKEKRLQQQRKEKQKQQKQAELRKQQQKKEREQQQKQKELQKKQQQKEREKQQKEREKQQKEKELRKKQQLKAKEKRKKEQQKEREKRLQQQQKEREKRLKEQEKLKEKQKQQQQQKGKDIQKQRQKHRLRSKCPASPISSPTSLLKKKSVQYGMNNLPAVALLGKRKMAKVCLSLTEKLDDWAKNLRHYDSTVVISPHKERHPTVPAPPNLSLLMKYGDKYDREPAPPPSTLGLVLLERCDHSWMENLRCYGIESPLQRKLHEERLLSHHITIAKAPKLELTQKYGNKYKPSSKIVKKTPSPIEENSDDHIWVESLRHYDSDDDNNVNRSQRGRKKVRQKQWRTHPTVPKAPNLTLWMKYGNRYDHEAQGGGGEILTQSTCASSGEEFRKHLRGNADIIIAGRTTTRAEQWPRPVTVATAPKLSLWMKYGNKYKPPAERSGSDNNRSVDHLQQAQKKQKQRKWRPLESVPVQPNLVLASRYGNKDSHSKSATTHSKTNQNVAVPESTPTEAKETKEEIKRTPTKRSNMPSVATAPDASSTERTFKTALTMSTASVTSNEQTQDENDTDTDTITTASSAAIGGGERAHTMLLGEAPTRTAGDDSAANDAGARDGDGHNPDSSWADDSPVAPSNISSDNLGYSERTVPRSNRRLLQEGSSNSPTYDDQQATMDDHANDNRIKSNDDDIVEDKTPIPNDVLLNVLVGGEDKKNLSVLDDDYEILASTEIYDDAAWDDDDDKKDMGTTLAGVKYAVSEKVRNEQDDEDFDADMDSTAWLFEEIAALALDVDDRSERLNAMLRGLDFD